MPLLRQKKTGSSGSGPVEVKLRKIFSVIPSDEQEKDQLIEDLTSMGCPGFIEKPWGFREERMVKELLGKLSNEFDNTLRGNLSLWSLD